jgi:hypothetical protein
LLYLEGENPPSEKYEDRDDSVEQQWAPQESYSGPLFTFSHALLAEDRIQR